MKKSELKKLISAVLNEMQEHCSPYMENEEGDEHDITQDPDFQAEFERWKQAHHDKHSSAYRGDKRPAGNWDDEAGYDLDDPKHPSYSERAADKADRARAEKKDSGLYEAADTTKTPDIKDDLRSIKPVALTKAPKVDGPADPTSGLKKEPNKGENTQMGKEDKAITSTDDPKSKEEGKKLPAKEKGSNTATNHFADQKGTAVVPGNEKKEGTKRPVGGNGAEDIYESTKDGVINMIRECIREHQLVKEETEASVAISHSTLEQWIKQLYRAFTQVDSQQCREARTLLADIIKDINKYIKGHNEFASINEMSRTKGAISTKDRVKDDTSPTGWVHRTTGEPVSPPSNTGKNYVKQGKVGMGRPKETPIEEPDLGSEYSFTFIDPSDRKIKLDPDLPWYVGNQLNSYLEANVMAFTGDLQARLDPKVLELLTTIKNRPEEVEAKHFVFRYSPSDHLLKVAAR